jgi:malonate transporter MadM subunit
MRDLVQVLLHNQLLVSFIFVGLIIWIGYALSKWLTRGRIHGSAIAISIGLLLAWVAGNWTKGNGGVSDLTLLTGLGLLGGGMLRDFAIVATAFGADWDELKKSGALGCVSIILGVALAYLAGATIAFAFGYRDPAEIVTIGAGAVTYIVGPLTGEALGVDSEIITLSIAAGLVKSILVMVLTPALSGLLQINNPQTAMVFGGLMGTTSGVSAGLAAVDPKLVPYGATTATFYTGVGCLIVPTLFLAMTGAIL